MTALTANFGQLAVWRLDDEAKKFANWLLIWVVLANIGFVAMWFSGAPPRHMDIIYAGLLGLVVKRMPFLVRYFAFAGILTFSTLKFVGGLFNLDMSSLLYSLQFFAEIKPGNSIDYIAGAFAILIVLVVAWKLLRRDSNFARPLLIIGAAAAVVSLAAVDLWMGKDMRGHYFRAAPAGALFGSATGDSGFAARADGKRHLVLIVVEAMGVPRNNPEMSKLLFAPLVDNSAVKARYDFRRGTAPYYNSTTAGEIRELCGRWGDYYDLLKRKDPSCLPAVLGKKGYDSLAMHSFTASFFKREDWYPNIGFAKREFGTDMMKAGAEKCGGVFPGACDRQIPKQIAAKLKAADKPTFLYWLTLNAHLPVPSGLNLNVDNCERVSALLKAEFPQICRQFAIYHDIQVALADEITAADFPDADILLVGDHMPPYFDRHHRTQFDPGQVPWLYLRRKDQADKDIMPR
ncbi:sulfatase-like hydrolase/transferase [Sphingorhabdus sp.]|uniref:sulfatase-like hydrolase/transferase n=1 Tax=Sphingorhabdus sp. TaxID=1902408 RepID=UPI003594710B